MLQAFDNRFAHLSSWIEGERSLVFCSRRETLVVLDSAGTGAFLGYCSRLSPTAVMEELQQDGGLSREAAEAAAKRVLRLIEPEQTLSDDAPRPEPLTGTWLPDAPDALMLRFGQSVVRLRMPAEWVQELSAILHQAIMSDTGDADAEWCIARDAVHVDGPRWALGDSRNKIISSLRREEVVPLLIDRLQALVYRRNGARLALHGAAIHWRGRNWLLPGASGAGKSTLSARLLQAGARCYSDEIIALDSAQRPTALNLPIALKSGSWGLFGATDLDAQPERRRRDGRRLKYRWPPQFATAEDARAPSLVVFPSFKSGAPVTVRPLGVIESLEMLSAAGYEFLSADPLGLVEGLARWLNHRPRFRLEYGENADLPETLWDLVS